MCFENLLPNLNTHDFGSVANIMKYKYLLYIKYNVKYLIHHLAYNFIYKDYIKPANYNETLVYLFTDTAYEMLYEASFLDIMYRYDIRRNVQKAKHRFKLYQD